MRKLPIALLVLLSFVGINYALPLPQPILIVPKTTKNLLQDKADYQIIVKTKVYKLVKEKIYELKSGERFKYGIDEVFYFTKRCLYKYYPSTEKQELIGCEILP